VIALVDRRERGYEVFKAFLSDFIRDLNNSSYEGWSLLVEGVRDARAIRTLGYAGHLFTASEYRLKGMASLAGTKKVIILTDLDHEGASLASKFIRMLNHEGVRTSLRERKRLKAASRGVFLQVENLARFA
jgi:5S rRNA maturation endonuclease (ribonuclease M5)